MSQQKQKQKQKVAGEAPAGPSTDPQPQAQPPPVFNFPNAAPQPREFGTESIKTAFDFTLNDESSKQAVCRMRRFAFSS